MEFRNHPIIKGLRINENGSEIYKDGVLLRAFENDKNRKNPTLKVNFNGVAHSVAKLVCEAWNKPREHIGQRASKINDLGDNHYSNLEWREGASNGVGQFKQKIKPDDIDDIIELLKNKHPVIKIAKTYNVNPCTIYRIKNNYVKENQ